MVAEPNASIRACRVRRVGLLACVAALGVLAAAVEATASSGVILESGTAQLGVRETGDLGVTGDLPSPGGVCLPPLGCGTTTIGLRQDGTGFEGLMDFCHCEGWGVAYDTPTPSSGWAQSGTPPGTGGLSFSSFSPYQLGLPSCPMALVAIPTVCAAGGSAGVVVTAHLGDLRIVHDYHATQFPGVFQVDVAFVNEGPTTLTGLRYRRVLDWDAEPSPASEFVSIGVAGPTPPELLCTAYIPFISADPTVAVTTPFVGPGSVCGGLPGGFGPFDVGFMIDIQARRFAPPTPLVLGRLDPMETTGFTMFYGVELQAATLTTELATLGAQVTSLAIPNLGNPVTGGQPIPLVAYGFGYKFTPCAPPDLRCTPCPPPPPPCPDVLTDPDTYPPPPVLPYYDCRVDYDGNGVFDSPTLGDHYPRGPCLPKPKFKGVQGTGCGPQPLVLTDLSSPHSTDSGIASWYWDFGDGNTDTSPPGPASPSHLYAAGGTYTVTLTVTGNNGYSASFTLTFTINPEKSCVGVTVSHEDGGGGGYPRDRRGSFSDLDLDGLVDPIDDCPTVYDPGQEDQDGDHIGDACDTDIDGDGIYNADDNCVLAPNRDQVDLDRDGAGDACDDDDDGDGWLDGLDNCKAIPNADQSDADGDLLGDLCDLDRDGDGVPNLVDCFPDDAARDCLRGSVSERADGVTPLGREQRAVTPPNGLFLGIGLAGWTFIGLGGLMAFLLVAVARRRRHEP